jgi:hypothetical protein
LEASIRPEDVSIKTVNLKSDMPQVHEAMQRLERELALARQGNAKLLKLIHGYGSTGAGGDIRIACIFGESWSKSDEVSWKLLQSHPELKGDSDLGCHNLGITIVLL